MVTSAAPLPGTRTTHEYHAAAARVQSAGVFDVNAGAGVELMVMTRCFTSNDGDAPPDARPWDGVAVLDSSGRVLADMTTAGRHETGRPGGGGDPVGVCTFALAPGAYVLRYPGEEEHAAQSLVLPPGGWRLEAYLLRSLNGGIETPLSRISLIMRRIGAPWGTAEDLKIEKARIALADERPILNEELVALLIQKCDNPLAGIIGGHLLLIEHEQGGTTLSLDLLNTVVKNLRMLVGCEHPDVEALSLECPNATLRRDRPVLRPPIFERSWRMLVKASYGNARLIPLSLWQQVHATLTAPPFLCWATDDAVQRGFRAALAAAVFGRPDDTPTSAAAPKGGLAAIVEAAAAGAARMGGVPRGLVRGMEVVADFSTPEAGAAGAQLKARAEALRLPPVALPILGEESQSG
jgi:hypothetical protein